MYKCILINLLFFLVNCQNITHINVHSGDNVEINCNIYENNNSLYYLNNFRFRNYIKNQSKLIIYEVSRYDNGIYLCNNMTKNHTFYLNVMPEIRNYIFNVSKDNNIIDIPCFENNEIVDNPLWDYVDSENNKINIKYFNELEISVDNYTKSLKININKPFNAKFICYDQSYKSLIDFTIIDNDYINIKRNYLNEFINSRNVSYISLSYYLLDFYNDMIYLDKDKQSNYLYNIEKFFNNICKVNNYYNLHLIKNTYLFLFFKPENYSLIDYVTDINKYLDDIIVYDEYYCNKLLVKGFLQYDISNILFEIKKKEYIETNELSFTDIGLYKPLKYYGKTKNFKEFIRFFIFSDIDLDLKNKIIKHVKNYFNIDDIDIIINELELILKKNFKEYIFEYISLYKSNFLNFSIIHEKKIEEFNKDKNIKNYYSKVYLYVIDKFKYLLNKNVMNSLDIIYKEFLNKTLEDILEEINSNECGNRCKKCFFKIDNEDCLDCLKKDNKGFDVSIYKLIGKPLCKICKNIKKVCISCELGYYGDNCEYKYDCNKNCDVCSETKCIICKENYFGNNCEFTVLCLENCKLCREDNIRDCVVCNTDIHSLKCFFREIDIGGNDRDVCKYFPIQIYNSYDFEKIDFQESCIRTLTIQNYYPGYGYYKKFISENYNMNCEKHCLYCSTINQKCLVYEKGYFGYIQPEFTNIGCSINCNKCYINDTLNCAECKTGYFGDNCDYNTFDCLDNCLGCLNGYKDVCVKCKRGFYGKSCELKDYEDVKCYNNNFGPLCDLTNIGCPKDCETCHVDNHNICFSCKKDVLLKKKMKN